jgi:hypothetical protein
MTAVLTTIDTKTARLPVTYEQASMALAQCYRVDECAEWANKAEAIASYARQSKDDTLLNTATKIRGRAIQRGGELLKQIPVKDGPPVRNPGSATRVTQTRKDIEEETGWSPDQQKRAMKVASVPAEKFKEMLEDAPKPATVTQLAAEGAKSGRKKASTSHLHGRDPADYKIGSRGQGAIEHFVRHTEDLDPVIVVRGTVPHEYVNLAKNMKAVVAWLKRLDAAFKKRSRK